MTSAAPLPPRRDDAGAANGTASPTRRPTAGLRGRLPASFQRISRSRDATRDIPPAGLDLRKGTLHGRPRRVVRWVVLAILRPLIGLRIEGLGNVPASGPALIVSNHLHNVDPIILCASFPRELHCMAKKEAFGVPVLPYIMRLVGAFPVDRGKADRNAIRHAEACLHQGIPVGMYPEGTRSVTLALQHGFPGVGMLALRSGAPVVPVALTGNERLPGNGGKAKARVGRAMPDPGHTGRLIRYGSPFIVPREIDGKKVTADQATEIIMVRIARMLPPDYRGVYAEAAARADAQEAAGSPPAQP